MPLRLKADLKQQFGFLVLSHVTVFLHCLDVVYVAYAFCNTKQHYVVCEVC